MWWPVSAEELQDQIDQAIEQAIAGEADLDAIEQVLTEAQASIDEVRAYREGSS